MSDRSISVVVPAYQARPFIAEALESVAGQRRPPEEIVVVDDGSTDDTAAEVEDWARRASIVTRVLRQPNKGPSAARNAGIEAARGDLIAFLDADDLLLPDHLRVLARAFEAAPDVVLAFGDAEGVREGRVERPSYFENPGFRYLRYRDLEGSLKRIDAGAFLSLLSGSYIATCASLVSRPAAKAAGPWDPTLRTAEDQDFWLRLSRVGPFAFTEAVVARVRYHSTNSTHPRHATRDQRNKLRVLLKMLARPDLSAEERERAESVARGTAAGVLYAASRRGLRSYARHWRFVMERGPRRPAANPRHLLRAVASDLDLLDPGARQRVSAPAPGGGREARKT